MKHYCECFCCSCREELTRFLLLPQHGHCLHDSFHQVCGQTSGNVVATSGNVVARVFLCTLFSTHSLRSPTDAYFTQVVSHYRTYSEYFEGPSSTLRLYVDIQGNTHHISWNLMQFMSATHSQVRDFSAGSYAGLSLLHILKDIRCLRTNSSVFGAISCLYGHYLSSQASDI